MVSNTRRRANGRAWLALAVAAASLAGCANLDELGDATFYESTTDSRTELSDRHGEWKLGLGPGADNIDTRLLYRAAIHAKAGGYPYVRIYSYGPVIGGGVELRSQGAGDASPPTECYASAENKGHCATWNADEVIATRGAALGRSQALIATDLADARNAEVAP